MSVGAYQHPAVIYNHGEINCIHFKTSIISPIHMTKSNFDFGYMVKT